MARHREIRPNGLRHKIAMFFEPLEDRRLLAGLTAADNQIWHQDMPELPDGSVPAIEGLALPIDQFGNVLAVGDFNGDSFPDLAIGSNESVFLATNGEDSVNVLYGSSSGLTTAGNQLWDQDSPGIEDSKELGDRFGFALAAGDLNGDGYDDLAIGAPGEGLAGNPDAGVVHLLFGSQTGISANGSQLLGGVLFSGEFGAALAIGDMDDDGELDLAVGSPRAVQRRGAVFIHLAVATSGNPIIELLQIGGGSSAQIDDRFGSSLAMGDFDRDGFDDLVVGVPGEDTEHLILPTEIDTGGINVYPGGPTGLSPNGRRFFSQDTAGILDGTGEFNEFGYALAVGDFNGDFVDDVAIGVPGETEGGNALAGAVNVIYGSLGVGLTSIDNEYFHQNTPRIGGVAEVGDNFGFSLAAGDFNGDTLADLIVGVPREDTNLADVGAFHILPGTPAGLEPDPNGPFVDVVTENTSGLTGTESPGAFFAAAIAVADFDQNGKADLAIGAPGSEPTARGAVHAIYGTSGSFQPNYHQIWKQGEGEQSLPQIAFGAAIAAGDFNGDGLDDMALGIPFQDLPTQQRWNKNAAGAVNVVYGDVDGLDIQTAEIWTQDRLKHPSTSNELSRGAEAGDSFGSALATGDFNGDGFDDLAIASPFEDLDGKNDVGMVNIVYGSRDGLTVEFDRTDFFAARNEFLWQGESSILDNPDVLDLFGHALAVGDFDGDGHDDLAVGVPGEEINAQPFRDSGAVQIFYGSTSGFRAGIDGNVRDQLWTVASANLNVPMRDEGFGTALAVGDFDGDAVDDIAIGAPSSIPDTFVTNSGFVGIMYGTPTIGLDAIGNHGLFGFGGLLNPQDQFGYSLAAGDLNGDGRDDLAVGAPFDDFPGLPPIIPDSDDVGTVNVYYGANDGLAQNQFDVWQQSNNGGATSALGVGQPGDHFGYSLAIADFDNDGFGDLVIGVPEQGTTSRLGEANVIHGAATGLDANRQQVWSQDSPDILDVSESGDQFAMALGTGDFDNDGVGDLLVGVPLEDINGLTNAGLVHTIYGEQLQAGDFDGNGLLDGDDVDSLSAVAVAGTHDPQFDLTGDGQVTVADVHFWVTQLKGTTLADANLDFATDASDFVIWNAHKFTFDTRWTHGNFNSDSVIDGSDFGVWNAHKFTSPTLTRPGEQDDEDVRTSVTDLIFEQLFA
jgi:hypothetical protein